MKITRYGEPCPLCRKPLPLHVLQVRSAQVGFPAVERVTERSCPGSQSTRRAQWTEAMRSHYGDV